MAEGQEVVVLDPGGEREELVRSGSFVPRPRLGSPARRARKHAFTVVDALAGARPWSWSSELVDCRPVDRCLRSPARRSPEARRGSSGGRREPSVEAVQPGGLFGLMYRLWYAVDTAAFHNIGFVVVDTPPSETVALEAEHRRCGRRRRDPRWLPADRRESQYLQGDRGPSRGQGRTEVGLSTRTPAAPRHGRTRADAGRSEAGFDPRATGLRRRGPRSGLGTSGRAG